MAHCTVSMRNAAVLNEWLVPIAQSACGPVGMCSRQHARGDATAMTRADVDEIVRNQADERRAGQRRRPAIAPANTNWARHQRGSPSMRRIADMVGLQFAYDPKEIAVEPRVLGTRLRITRAYRSYSARVGVG
jgi:hypothetical protein